jgi:hypothetical protein
MAGGWSGVQQYGPFDGIATSVEPAVTATTTTTTSSVTIGLPSPLGNKIPQGIGTFPAQGQLIVHPDLLGGISQSDTAVKINLVIAFAETTLGGPVDLINLKANDKYIYRTELPAQAFPGTLRFYGGDQAALDPLLSGSLDNPTYWPKLAYAVLEGFDIRSMAISFPRSRLNCRPGQPQARCHRPRQPSPSGQPSMAAGRGKTPSTR